MLPPSPSCGDELSTVGVIQSALGGHRDFEEFSCEVLSLVDIEEPRDAADCVLAHGYMVMYAGSSPNSPTLGPNERKLGSDL